MSYTLSSFFLSSPLLCHQMVGGKRFALIGCFDRMRGGLVGGHRTGVREDGGGGGGHELRPPSISIVTRGQTAQAFRANRDMHS